MKRSARCVLIGCVYLALFLGLIVLLLTANFYTETVLFQGENYNASHWITKINVEVFQEIGTNDAWYKITEALGMLPFLAAACFGVLGLWQWIRRKSLKRVDPDLFCLAGLYVLTMAVYVGFEVFVVNYRPILVDGQAEASFPSSHTMLALVFLGSAGHQVLCRIRTPWLRISLYSLCCLIAVLIAVGRLLAGVHWFTDILGGILIGGALLFFYKAAVYKCSKR